MNPRPSQNKKSASAFTLLELTVILATVVLVISLILPALAHAHIKTAAAQCLSNYRHLQLGWELYREDHNDALMLNAPVSSATTGWVPANMAESWNTTPANTNVVLYATSTMGIYLNQDITAFRCPADILPSVNGYRLRSSSMNGQFAAPVNYNSGYRLYNKGADLNCPGPANLFVFGEEGMASLNDGYLQLKLSSPLYPDVPANYHNGSGSFGFVDGHAVIHAWKNAPLLTAPYQQGVTYQNLPTSATDTDWVWLSSHSGCLQ